MSEGTTLEQGFAGLPSAGLSTVGPQTSGVMTNPTAAPDPASTPAPSPAAALAPLPGAAAAPHLPSHLTRPFKRYKLTKELVGAGWHSSDFTESDLEFGMTEITTDQRLRASRLAGGAKMDFQAVNLEQTYQTIYMIGGKLTNNNRGVIKAWFEAIGPKGQDVVERIFAEMTSATESEVQEVLKAGEWETG